MDSGDTAWTLACVALVLLMTPGLAFFYSGLVREKVAINTIKMSFVALALIALEWVIIGYSMAFGPGGSAWIGGLSWVGLNGVGAEPYGVYSESIPHLVFMAFQMMFAIITPALISGAIVGRMKFKSYALFIVLWALVVYNPLAHWVWGAGGWISAMGALDFAGGTVVHISAGFSALVAAIILGPCKRPAGETERPHNVPFVVLGASLLWFGWFGFNAGSALAADGVAALAVVTTMLSASAALVTWISAEMLHGGKPSAVGASIGAVVGLVGITPAAGFVTPMSAILIGMITSTISYVCMSLLNRTRLDDTLDVFACHGLGGVSGALLTGVFATTTVNSAGADGLLYGSASLLWSQLISVLAGAALAVIGSTAILFLLKATIGLRPTEEDEMLGLDATEHAESAYSLQPAARVVATQQADGQLEMEPEPALVTV